METKLLEKNQTSLYKLRKTIVRYFVRPKFHKYNFIRNMIPANAKVMDVGCGNNSPEITKTLRPDIYYIGIDIGMYNQQNNVYDFANEMVITEPESFAQSIEQYANQIDCVISEHNLEHVNDMKGTLQAMLKSVNGGGVIYLAFPCEESVNFPKRKGTMTLNFYDDETHVNVIPYSTVLSILKEEGFKILFSSKRYRPFWLFGLGLILEPFSRLFNWVPPFNCTWAFYGFESKIIAQKMKL
jgi:SAM-dependent methyltransferase